MPNASLADLQRQARINYAIWPLWLVLQRRRVEKLLAASGAGPDPDLVALLKTIRLPLPDDLSGLQWPESVSIEGTTLSFSSIEAGQHAALIVLRDGQQAILLRTKASNRWYVEGAAKRLNAALNERDPQAVFDAARAWAALHGAPLPLDWQPVEPSGGWS